MKFKAIVSDLDGTLLDDKGTPDSKTTSYLIDFQKKGGYVVLATSRHFFECKAIAKKVLYSNQGYLVCSDGLYTYNDKLELIYTNDFLGIEDLKEIEKKYRNSQLLIVTDGFDYIYRPNNIIKEVVKNIFVSLINNSKQKRKIINSFDQIKEKQIEKCIVTKEKRTIIKTNKGNAVINIINSLSVDINEVIVFGDDSNDLEMFRLFNNCFAMKNANEEIKSLANKVIGSNNDSGIYYSLLEMEK